MSRVGRQGSGFEFFPNHQKIAAVSAEKSAQLTCHAHLFLQHQEDGSGAPYRDVPRDQQTFGKCHNAEEGQAQ